LSVAGFVDLSGGYLFASNIVLSATSAAQAQFWRGSSGNIVNPGTFSMLGAIFYPGSGSNQFGTLIVGTTLGGTIDFGPGSARASSIVRFADSHSVQWNNTELAIRNWNGSVAGGGADQLYFGNSPNGLNSAQLGVIHFYNPAGFPTQPNTETVYNAKILATGEVVPLAAGGVLAFTRTSSGLTLSWDSPGYQLLSSTNVAGPYQPLSPQPSSPYTINFTGPHRFFELRQLP
jgi:hypothetical protein